MSFLQKLYETYENCSDVIGKREKDKLPLIPICHTTNNAQIEVVLDINGNFLRAFVIGKDDAETIIPCTEESASRSGSAIYPHPLFDKLSYVAGDFTRYCSRKSAEYFEKYIAQLSQWAEADPNNSKLQAVFNYLSKSQLITDLVEFKIICLDATGMIMENWTGSKEDKPAIFGVTTAYNPKANDDGEEKGSGGQSEAFVRFAVEKQGDPHPELWWDRTLWDSFIDFYLNTRTDCDLCMITGETLPYIGSHSKKIRNSGDAAKIISANDKTNYTYRGRFTDPRQAASIGFEVSQKAHNALRWLVDRQGFKNGDGPQTFVAWSTTDKPIPSLVADGYDFYNDLQDDEVVIDTAEAYARRLNNAMAGYKQDLGFKDDIVVLGLDSATTGRLSVIMYKLLSGSDFLERIKKWHSTCTWIHYRKIDKKPIRYMGAPSPNDIALGVFGKSNGKSDEKLKNNVRERIIRCIVGDLRLSADIVNLAVQRARNPLGHENWEWERILSVACALYNKLYEERCYQMALEEGRHTRDYLYGRLLAVADKLEARVLYEAEVNRETNAMRYMSSFSSQPYKVWQIIYKAIAPYRSQLNGKSRNFYENLFTEIINNFEPDHFMDNGPLSGEFLLGFYCQREALRKKEDN